MHFKKSFLVATLFIATTAIAQTSQSQFYQGKLSIGIDVLPPSYTADQSAWLAQQGCDFQNTYVPMYNEWAQNTEKELNNSYSQQYMNQMVNKAPEMDVNSCLSGPMGQLSNIAGSFSKVYGLLTGDISAGEALNFAQRQATQQACSIASQYGNQMIQSSGISGITGITNNVTNPGNLVGGQTGGLINGMINAATQNPPPPPTNTLNLLK